MRKSFLIPLGTALAAVSPAWSRAQPAAVTTVEPRQSPLASKPLASPLLALPRTSAAAPAGHYSHSSHVSHASHVSHFSSATPPAPPPPASTGGILTKGVHGFATDVDLSRALQTHGMTFRGKHIEVTNALCAGEPQHGAKWVGYQLEYHRFSCTLFDASYNMYDAQVVITKSNSRYFWWRLLGVKLL